VRTARTLDIDLAEAFRAQDHDGRGWLGPAEVASLARELVPDASELEVAHARVMAVIGAGEEVGAWLAGLLAAWLAGCLAAHLYCGWCCSSRTGVLCAVAAAAATPQPQHPYWLAACGPHTSTHMPRSRSSALPCPQLAFREWRDQLDLHRRIHGSVRRHKDSSEVMQRLFDYLFDNEEVRAVGGRGRQRLACMLGMLSSSSS
jgi:hypothetical protein